MVSDPTGARVGGNTPWGGHGDRPALARAARARALPTAAARQPLASNGNGGRHPYLGAKGVKRRHRARVGTRRRTARLGGGRARGRRFQIHIAPLRVHARVGRQRAATPNTGTEVHTTRATNKRARQVSRLVPNASSGVRLPTTAR